MHEVTLGAVTDNSITDSFGPSSIKDKVIAILERLGWKTLDDVKNNHALATVLGLLDSDKHSLLSLARELVRQGYMSGLMPKDHALSKVTLMSNYAKKEVVLD